MSYVAKITQFLTIRHPVSLVKGIVSDADLVDILDNVGYELKVADTDLLVVAEFDMQAYEDVLSFASTKPYGSLKLIAMNLTGSTAKQQRSLLQLLEMPSGQLKFILFSENDLIPTLTSRCQVLRIYDRFMPQADTKTKVLKALASTSLGEKKLLLDTLSKWAHEDTEAMKIWAYESLSGRYETFSREEIEGLGLTEEFSQALIEALETLRAADYKRVISSLLMAQIAAQKGTR
jgi:DNA polymerase III delta prime subunit